MDVHILDLSFRGVDVVDDFLSLVWTERRDAYGEFVIDIPWTKSNAETFAIGTMLMIPQSYRVMTVETHETKIAEDNSKMLTVKGRSIEAWMLDRSTRLAAVGGTSGLSTWTLTGTPSEIVHAMFDARCRNNTTIPADNFLNLGAGSFLPTGSIPEDTDEYSVQVELQSVYDFIKDVCETFAMGFRLVRNPTTFQLHFDVFTGDDRTTLQATNDPVIFSSSLDNLMSQSTLLSQTGAKNVAYVFGKNGTEIVYADATNGPSLTGTDRKVLFVNADDVDLAPGTELTNVLTIRGLQELAKNRSVIALDGEVPQYGAYLYGTHYDLGDLLEMRGDDDLTTNMRVTEQIFISDAEGDRSYPTLVSEMLISSGYWYGWGGNVYWDDAVGYWEDA